MNLRKFCIGSKLGVYQLGSTITMLGVGILSIAVMPYHIYKEGAQVAWIYAGVFVMLQVAFGWLSFRLMRYARKNSRVYTVPSYFRVRFNLGRFSTGVIALFYVILLFLLYMIYLAVLGRALAGFGIAGKEISIIIAGAFTLMLIIIAGIRAGVGISMPLFMIMIITVTAIVISVISKMGLGEIVRNTIWSDIEGSVSDYINVMKKGTRMIYPEELIDYLSYGLFVMGFIPLLVLFLATPTAKVIKKSRRLTALSSVILFVGSAFLGGVSRAMLFPADTAKTFGEYITHMVEALFSGNMFYRILGGAYVFILFLIAFLISIVLLHTMVGILVNDIMMPAYIRRINDSDKSHKEERIVIIAAAFLVTAAAVFAACGLEGDFLGFTLGLLMIMGVCTGPVVLLSLYIKWITAKGLMAGFLTGIIAVYVWEFVPIFEENARRVTMHSYVGIGAQLPAFFAVLIITLIVSLLTWKRNRNAALENMFDEVKNRIV